MFPIKKDVFNVVTRNVDVHENANVPTSNYVVRYSVDEPRTSKKCKVVTSFGPDLYYYVFG